VSSVGSALRYHVMAVLCTGLIAQLNAHLLVVGSFVLGGSVRVGMADVIVRFGFAFIAFFYTGSSNELRAVD
jgi:hypothetical protein